MTLRVVQGGSIVADYFVGDGRDDVAPTFADGDAAAELVAERRDAPVAGFDGVDVEVSVPRASDEAALAITLFELRLDDGDFAPAAAILPGDEQDDVARVVAQVRGVDFFAAPHDLCWRARAIDVGGNETVHDSIACVATARGCAQAGAAPLWLAVLPLARARRRSRARRGATRVPPRTILRGAGAVATALRARYSTH